MAEMNHQQRLAHTLWMTPEPTNDEIAESIGVSRKTLESWKKKFEWPNRNDVRAAAENITTTSMYEAPRVTESAEPADTESYDDRLVALERELREAQRRALTAEKDAQEARAEAFRNSPVVDISDWMWETAEDVLEHFRTDRERETGAMPSRLVDVAMLQLGASNKERISRGLEAHHPRDEDLMRRVLEVADEILRRRFESGADNPHGTRAIKMADGQGNLRHATIENQVNNHAGSMNDSLAVYINKGWKHVTPTLCASLNCWMAAAVGPNGGYMFRGYCSPDHERLCEENKMGDDRNPALQQANASPFTAGPRLAGAAGR